MPSGIHLWSQTANSNATADSLINWAEGQAPSSVNDSARQMMAKVADFLKDLAGITTAGSSTAYTITSNRAFASAAVMDGQIIVIRPHTTSGLNPTLSVDTLTARQIRSATGVNVPTGGLISGTPYALIYVHASTEFILLGGVGALTGLDIDGGTALTAPDTADELAIYDASATANRKITLANFFKSIDTITALTAPDTADELVIYDASGTAAFKITLANFFKAIDTLTAKATPVAADEVVIYDVAGAASKKATLTQLNAGFPGPFTTQKLDVGSGTYTTPANCRGIRIRQIAGGGGGGGATANNGSAGGTTSFNSIDCAGGSGGGGNSNTGASGGTGGAGGSTVTIAGGDGLGVNGGNIGGSGPFGGAGKGASNSAGSVGKSNSGGGGGGGSSGASAGSGGGAGEYKEHTIASPAATYSYTVGDGGAGGAAGGSAGGKGGSGVILVDEYY